MTDMPSPIDLNSQIQQAAQLIRTGDKPAAKRVVADMIKVTKENADVWYLYALLLDDPTKRRKAVDRALAITPNHIQAKQLSDKLNTDDLVGDLFSEPGAPQYPPTPAYQQPIIVNVNQDNHAHVSATATAIANGGKTKQVDQMAMFAGVIFGLFGIFGVSHLLTGKWVGALVHFISGFGWLAVAALVISFNSTLGFCIAAPLHFYIAFNWSKRGAQVHR